MINRNISYHFFYFLTFIILKIKNNIVNLYIKKYNIEMKEKTIVINLTGGPGSGKSTTMAGVFYNLKKRGYNCEMAPEFAKEKVWEESYKMMDNQLYIFGKQFHRMWRLANKVDIIITDAPLFHNLYYDKEKNHNLSKYTMDCFDKFINLTYFIERDENTFLQKGRIQDLEESKQIDNEIKKILSDNDISYKILRKIDAVEEITDYIIKNIDK